MAKSGRTVAPSPKSVGTVTEIYMEASDTPNPPNPSSPPNPNVFFRLELFAGPAPNHGYFVINKTDNFEKIFALLLLAAGNHYLVEVEWIDGGYYSNMGTLTIRPPAR